MIRPVRPDGTIETGGVFVPIPRRRVLERIASAAMQRVVLVIAPAGYGKSVALRQYLEALKERHVRYDVLPENANLLGFLRGFADALTEIAPDARITLPGAYEKNATSSTPGIDLALWMHSHLRTFQGVIAIDDLHLAQEDREVTRFLGSLIERTKGRVQWLIASRSTLGLPIGTWLAYGDSDLAIDEHDLKFSVEEAREAARTFKLAVRDEELYELLNLTDGWATAMSFALRSSTRSVDLRNVSSMTRDMIYRYLAEQVYASLRDEDRDFIETAALLTEIDIDVLVAVGFDRAAVMLEELRERVAFISEPEPGHYRLHELFREFTTHQLELRGKVAMQEKTLQVARALADSGNGVDALALFVRSGARDEARALLAERGLWMATHGYTDELARAIEMLGEEVPLTRALRGVIAIGRGNYAEGERLLQHSIQRLDDPVVRAELSLRLGLLRANRGEDIRPELSTLLDDPAVPEAKKVEARALLAGYFAMHTDRDTALHFIQETEVTLVDVHDAETVARSLQRLGFSYLRLRESSSAVNYLKQAIEIATGRGMWSLASRAYGLLAEISIFDDVSPSLTLWNAQQAASAASRAGDHYDLQSSLLMMMSVEIQRGNPERMQHIERQLGELSGNDSARAYSIAEGQAHRFAWTSKFDDAHRLFGSILDRQYHAPERIFVHSLYALTLALGGQGKQSAGAVETTVALLNELRDDDLPSGLYLDAALLFVVAAELVSARLTSAARLLKRDLRSRHEIAKCMHSVVGELVNFARNPSYSLDEFESGITAIRDFGYGGFARYLQLARERLEAAQEVPEDAVLTPSELKILRDLAAGMSPKEIAASMGRSVYTVQTHIQNITGKLGAHGRAEAIAAARKRGLLAGGGNGST